MELLECIIHNPATWKNSDKSDLIAIDETTKIQIFGNPFL